MRDGAVAIPKGISHDNESDGIENADHNTLAKLMYGYLFFC
jgi:hypothetical protein